MRFLLVAILLLFAHAGHANNVFPFPGKPGTYAPAVGPTFVTLASSDYSGETIPSATYPETVDTSGWDVYDVTCECASASCAVDAAGDGCTPASGTAAFPNTWGLTPAVADDGTNDSATLYGVISNGGDQTLAYVPDGQFDIDSGNFSGAGAQDGFFWRPGTSTDRRGFVCESRSAILNVKNGMNSTTDRLIFMEGEEPVTGTATSWNGGSGAASGTTRILVADNSGFSSTEYATGNWVVLTASANSVQGDNTPHHRAQVTATGNNGASDYIDIHRALVADFDGGGATATPWTPASEIVMRNCTIQEEGWLHVFRGSGHLIHTRGMAQSEFTNNKIGPAYHVVSYVENSADIWFQHNDFDGRFDKGPNGYGLVCANSTGLSMANNSIKHPTGIAFAGGCHAPYFGFNTVPGPDAACTDLFDTGGPPQTSGSPDGYCDSDGATGAFDIQCNSGGGLDCLIAGTVGLHSSHGPEPDNSGTAYFHCSSNNDDAGGVNTGDSACRGIDAGFIYSCFEFHNTAGFGAVVERNLCGGPAWYDFTDGPGRNNIIFANRFLDTTTTVVSPFAPGDGGDFHLRDEGGGPTLTYESNNKWWANIFKGNFGDGSYGFDAYGNGFEVKDNVMSGCETQSSGTDPDGGLCTNNGTANPGVGTVFEWNCVGDDHHDGAGCSYKSGETGGYSRAVPSSLVLSDWPDFGSVSPTGTAPYIGPDLGDPDSLASTQCLPATQRLFGSCAAAPW